MTNNEEKLMNEFIIPLDDKYKKIFLDLANYASSLGFGPVRNNTKFFSIDFRNKGLKKSIMKMNYKEQRHDEYKFGERKRPGLRLKFFSSNNYSSVFTHAVKTAIEDFDGRYQGCFNCGRCKGRKEGYHYTYDDGREVFYCGIEQISVFDFEDSIDEIKRLLKSQSDYFYIKGDR